ncbi:MAG: hypothetical protein ACTSV2_01540, partial [Candidatus Thorarchaeota archaeon]
ENNGTVTLSRSSNDLGFDLNSGFFVCWLEDVSAQISQVEIIGADGTLLGIAEHTRSGYYLLSLGDATIGDIRVICEGTTGQYVTIRSMSFWGL